VGGSCDCFVLLVSCFWLKQQKQKRVIRDMYRQFLLVFYVAFVLMGCVESQSIYVEPPSIHTVIFHDVSPYNVIPLSVSPDYFEDTLRMITLSGKVTLFASEVAEFVKKQNVTTPAISITCDDAWPGIVDYADPLVNKYNLKATFFVHLTGIESGRPQRCNWDDLQRLQHSGRWEIQSHSYSHAEFVKLDKDQLIIELQKSRRLLLDHGLGDVNLIAYPCGTYSSEVQKIAKDCGYVAAFTAGPIPNATSGSDLFAIPRTTVCQLYDQDLLCRKMGIDLQSIREELAIYDEREGTFTGHWETIPYDQIGDKDSTFGQYGRSYAITNKGADVWSIDFVIKKEGKYTISTWIPLRDPKDAEIDIASVKGRWTLLEGWKEGRKEGRESR
jgi:peptidoglycan/xylan/chitin deacetylase (PgdA/CDA1 family)